MTRYAVISSDDTVAYTDDRPSEQTIANKLVVMLDDEEGGSFALLSSSEPTEYWFLGSLEQLVDDARDAQQNRLEDE